MFWKILQDKMLTYASTNNSVETFPSAWVNLGWCVTVSKNSRRYKSISMCHASYERSIRTARWNKASLMTRISLTWEMRCDLFMVIRLYNFAFTSSTLTSALPFVNTVFPPSTLTMNRTSSNPPSFCPVCHISVISLSPGFTGAANRAWNSFKFSGFDLPNCCRTACAAVFQLNKPWMMGPPKPILTPGSGVA